MTTYNMLSVTSLLKLMVTQSILKVYCLMLDGKTLPQGGFRAGVLTSTCLTAPAVLNEFCGDYTRGYFGNGLKDISLDPHKVSTMCTQGIL